jgi:GTP-binding protein Era
MTENTRWTEEDEFVLQYLKKIKAPVIWVLNKIDQVKDKEELLPHIEKISKEYEFVKVVPMCARRIKDVQRLLTNVQEYLPESPDLLYPAEQITDRQESFIMAEYIRESLLNALGDEVPHVLTTVVEKVERKPKIIVIHAVIYVERESHKAIIIGKQGERLRAVGQEARIALEKYLGQKVFLELWVKVKEGWIDDKKAMSQLGYKDSE